VIVVSMIVVVVVVAVVIVTVGIVLGSTGSSSRPGYHGPADRRAHRKRHGELGESGKRVHIGAAWMQTVDRAQNSLLHWRQTGQLL
jgi:hypothetical protein